ncbi:hypothetical protein TNCV_4214131 [Trichonephila clavipes]|nr:hypothetical protein TNCV_4214131 [Trichonephila clavipes]
MVLNFESATSKTTSHQQKFDYLERNDDTSTTDQHRKRTETSTGTRGHKTTPQTVKGDIEDISSELDDGV